MSHSLSKLSLEFITRTAEGTKIGVRGHTFNICRLSVPVSLFLFSFLRGQSSAGPVSYGSEHGLRTHDDKIPNSHQPKTISQSQIENPVKCKKFLSSFLHKK